jgi:hypothetical protein
MRAEIPTRWQEMSLSVELPGGHRFRLKDGVGKFLALPVALAADELFDAAVSFVVAHLDGRMLREISRRRIEDAADAAIEG